MCTCCDDHMLKVNLLWWSHAPMFRYSDVQILRWSHVLMIICSHAYMLWQSHAYLLVWLHAYMLGCFNDYMLLRLNALIIICSQALIFTFLISTHMCTHLNANVFRLKGLSDHVAGHLCAQMFWRFFLNAEMNGRLEFFVLRFLNAYRLVCSHDHMLVCCHALLITFSHLSLLWW